MKFYKTVGRERKKKERET